MAVHFPLGRPIYTPAVSASLLQRICAEYTAMPGLNLTAAQAKRLWGLDDATSSAALAALVDDGFLSRTDGGLFALAAAAFKSHAGREDSA